MLAEFGQLIKELTNYQDLFTFVLLHERFNNLNLLGSAGCHAVFVLLLGNGICHAIRFGHSDSNLHAIRWRDISLVFDFFPRSVIPLGADK